MKHRHCGVIKAWAEGAIVQYKDEDGTWGDCLGYPTFYDNVEFRASLAIVEGKPVFEGDVLYFDGTCVAADIVVHRATADCIVDQKGGCWSIDKLHWTPPKPKTITVTIPYDAAKEFSVQTFWNNQFIDIQNAIKEAMK